MKKGVIISGGTIERDFALAFLQKYRRGVLPEDMQIIAADKLDLPPKDVQIIAADKLDSPPEEVQIIAADRLDLPPEDVQIIAADRGLAFCLENGIVPDGVVGDFDSADRSLLDQLDEAGGTLVRTFQPEKDWTDTELAVDLAMELGWEEAVLLGGSGTRLDHVLGNLQVMELALRKGMRLILADSHNWMWMSDRGFTLSRDAQRGRYVSLIPWGGPVEGLTLRGFHYETDSIRLVTGASRGISNEIDADTASVRFASGTLLVVESRD